MPRADYGNDAEYEAAINEELELHEYYQEKNVFWVPKDARWNYLKSSAALPMNSILGQDEKGNDITLRSISWLIDNALESIETYKIYGKLANPKLKGILPRISRFEVDNNGQKNADSFLDDQHPDLRADYVMANPPFNIEDWWHAKLENDVRWKYGTPPQGNANFGWIQHMLYHLSDTGSMALLLANGSMSSSTNNEGEIRKNLILGDAVECKVALPWRLFTNTQIPASIWFLTKDKKNSLALDKEKVDRRGKFLFIDARNLGYMKDRVLSDFTDDDRAKIVNAFHRWQQNDNYENEKGFCHSATLEEIEKHDFVLTPGRYVGAVEQEEDGEPFAEKMTCLTELLKG